MPEKADIVAEAAARLILHESRKLAPIGVDYTEDGKLHVAGSLINRAIVRKVGNGVWIVRYSSKSPKGYDYARIQHGPRYPRKTKPGRTNFYLTKAKDMAWARIRNIADREFTK